jgi:hypothetical protein
MDPYTETLSGYLGNVGGVTLQLSVAVCGQCFKQTGCLQCTRAEMRSGDPLKQQSQLLLPLLLFIATTTTPAECNVV